MRPVARSSLLNAAVAGLVLLGPAMLAGQDYVQYESQYLIALPGQSEDLEQALADHNRRFHNQGAFLANVSFIVNGPRTGQLFWVMGPGTWTQWDARPADDAHDSDWANNVMAHARNGRTEYWRRIDALSSEVDEGDEPRPLSRIRFFSVEDAGLFRQTQAMIEAVVAAGQQSRSRTFFARQFASPDGRDFALVESYRNWAELDEGGGGGRTFAERFIDVHGLSAWEQFQEDREAAGVTAMDEWHQALPELSGGGMEG
jgi:hypothetical protein